MDIGDAMVRCDNCILIPSDLYEGDSPRLDAMYKSGRESWYVTTGSMTMGGATFAISSEFFPCDSHLITLHKSYKPE